MEIDEDRVLKMLYVSGDYKLIEQIAKTNEIVDKPPLVLDTVIKSK